MKKLGMDVRRRLNERNVLTVPSQRAERDILLRGGSSLLLGSHYDGDRLETWWMKYMERIKRKGASTKMAQIRCVP
jgi:hypothetical protein